MHTLGRSLLIVILLAGGLLAVSYAFAPQLLALFATRLPEDLVEVQALTIESLRPGRIEIAEVRTRTRGLNLEAQGVTADLQLWPFRVRGIAIDRLSLSLRENTDAAPFAGTMNGSLPGLPLPFPLRIAELQLQAATPWGETRLAGMLAARPTNDGGFVASLRGPDISAMLAVEPAGGTQLEIRDAGGGLLARLAGQLGAGPPSEIAAALHPSKLGEWLQRTDLVPAALRPELPAYRLGGERVEVVTEFGRDGGLYARLRGRLEIRDTREPAQRQFESLGIGTDADYFIHHDGRAWSGAGGAELEFVIGPERHLDAADPSWHWDGAALHLGLTRPRLPAQGVSSATLEVKAAGLTRTSASGQLRLAGLRTDNWPAALAPYEVDGGWSWDHGRVQADGVGRGPALPEVDWRLSFADGQGQVEAELRAPVARLAPSLEHYTASFARELRIRSGELNGHYRLDWTPEERRSDLRLEFGPLDADLNAMAIRGLKLAVASDHLRIEPVTVTVSAPRLGLAGGATARDLAVNLRASRAQIRIAHGRAGLFGGTVALRRPTTIETDSSRFVIEADLEALSLAQLLALFELESAELTGRVSGGLRLDYNEARGAILDGALQAVEPGVLRLHLGPELAQAGQFEDLARRALRDFRYDALSANVRYQSSDGAYRIGARIVGRNPDVLDGHPIALNPTIEGQLPALFSTFFLTGDFNQAILEGLQEEGRRFRDD